MQCLEAVDGAGITRIMPKKRRARRQPRCALMEIVFAHEWI
jgi:hypothetical protein